jgi:hypothetical protein
MSTWFKDNTHLLLEETKSIAWDFLNRSNEIDDPAEARQFLSDRLEFMIGQGQRNKLLLSNRAIAAFQVYKKARTIGDPRELVAADLVDDVQGQPAHFITVPVGNKDRIMPVLEIGSIADEFARDRVG